NSLPFCASNASPTGSPLGATGQWASTLACVNVHDCELIFILEIDIYLASIIRSKELGFATQVDRRINLAVNGVHIGASASPAHRHRPTRRALSRFRGRK